MFALNLMRMAWASLGKSVYETHRHEIFGIFGIARRDERLVWPGHWLWRRGIYYDVIHMPAAVLPLRVRSLVG